MRDLLATAGAWLAAKRLEFMSQYVNYTRGVVTVQVRATIGRTIFEQIDSQGVVERTESRDFLIPAGDLVLNGAASLPVPHDRIAETQGAVTYTYEVMAPGAEPCWRWSDPYRQTLRVHTKQVAVA